MAVNEVIPSTVHGINLLSAADKRRIYSYLVPKPLIAQLAIPPDFVDAEGHDLLRLNAPEGSSVAEMALYHRHGFPDPVVYGHVTDTLNGQLHILLYIINDPTGPRFDVDRMPDGQPTQFGTRARNLPAEIAAMQAGLAPGQVRRGMRMLSAAVGMFEEFVALLGHDRYFAEPLYYHNAIILERAGFAYQKGRRLMERIDAGFSPGGELRARLDGSTPFRQPQAAERILLRSWAIHDGILGEPFTDVTVYKVLGESAGVRTSSDLHW